jgi:hypothetical protein
MSTKEAWRHSWAQARKDYRAVSFGMRVTVTRTLHTDRAWDCIRARELGEAYGRIHLNDFNLF